MERKRDQAIKDVESEKIMEEIIKSCDICHVGMVDGQTPYVLGFNFGFQNNIIYLHCAKEGKKIDILRKNPNVCVSFSADYKIFARHEHVACSWRMRYRSILAYGKVEFVNDYDEKLAGLAIFMNQYSAENFVFNKPSVDNIVILKIKVDEWTGRTFEY